MASRIEIIKNEYGRQTIEKLASSSNSDLFRPEIRFALGTDGINFIEATADKVSPKGRVSHQYVLGYFDFEQLEALRESLNQWHDARAKKGRN